MSGKQIVYNKKAGFNYEFIETIESGIELKGTEVKSLRAGKCSIAESYIIDSGNELFIKNMNVSEYSHGNINNHEPLRLRKLLLHRKEIARLILMTKQKGITLIPVSLYFKGSLVKVQVALAKGKKEYDKRDTIKKRETDREIKREIKNYNS